MAEWAKRGDRVRVTEEVGFFQKGKEFTAYHVSALGEISAFGFKLTPKQYEVIIGEEEA